LVREALDTLDPAARNLVLLAEFAGLSTQELATVLSIPAGTVGSRKHHAMARLRSALGERAHE
jgi:RNA polymerase sigma-70 factor (ECF subfamily)